MTYVKARTAEVGAKTLLATKEVADAAEAIRTDESEQHRRLSATNDACVYGWQDGRKVTTFKTGSDVLRL
jgi:hypothetical protein